MSSRLEAAVAELVVALREELAADRRPLEPNRLLSVDQASDALSIGRTRLYAELQSGRLRSIKVGRRRLIPSGAIAERIGR